MLVVLRVRSKGTGGRRVSCCLLVVQDGGCGLEKLWLVEVDVVVVPSVKKRVNKQRAQILQRAG